MMISDKQLYKYCKNPYCSEYFPSELQSIEIYCPKCKDEIYINKETRQWWWINKIKQNRSFTLNTFDIYDLEKPIRQNTMKGKNQIIGYERVCRICGNPLKNKDGKYSYHRRYCSKKECNASELYSKFNWKGASSEYIYDIYKKQKEKIKKNLEELNFSLDKIYKFILCEECGKLCTKETYWYSGSFYGSNDLKQFGGINVHHKQPVHTLTEANILLLFKGENLIILCIDCHSKQDHLLSKAKKVDSTKFKTIEDWVK